MPSMYTTRPLRHIACCVLYNRCRTLVFPQTPPCKALRMVHAQQTCSRSCSTSKGRRTLDKTVLKDTEESLHHKITRFHTSRFCLRFTEDTSTKQQSSMWHTLRVQSQHTLSITTYRARLWLLFHQLHHHHQVTPMSRTIHQYILKPVILQHLRIQP